MRPSVRPSTPDDAPGIAALLTSVFTLPPDAQVVDPDHMRWKYWQERADRLGSRSFVVARGEEILAHAGIIPGTLAWGDERLEVVHLIDWAARRGVMGAGIMLMKHLGGLADIDLAVGGSEDTLRILPSMGFRPAGTATQYVRLLHPSRAWDAATEVGRRALPSLVARSLVANATGRRRLSTAWTSKPVLREDLDEMCLPLPAPTPGMAVLERSPALFAHALACPAAGMVLYAVERGGGPRGYFLLAFSPGRARIADCWMDSEEASDWRAMIELAVREAKKHPHVARLGASASDPLLSRCLMDCGFLAGRADLVQLHPKGGRPMPRVTVRVQMLDNDFAWL